MNALWLVPAVVITIGMGIAWYLLREAAAAARELRDGVVRFGEVRLELQRLRGDTDDLRRGFERHTRK